MFYMGAGDKEGVGRDIKVLVFDTQFSKPMWNIVDLVAAAAMTVRGDCPDKAFKDYIQCMETSAFYGEMDIHICVESFHGSVLTGLFDPFIFIVALLGRDGKSGCRMCC